MPTTKAPVKPNLEKAKLTDDASETVQPVEELDDATKARLTAAEKAKIRPNSSKLNVQS